ncbi:MAG: Wzz/FepE/Etk N-terminal domain-containing protein [Candidatus Theseobacter exili]|nr:Wzz/FepE/Etk N-terminal domain-containing protein [Candidatus Theseobacter exili]
MLNTEDYKRELISIFFAQRKLIFFITILFFIVAVLVSFLWPPVYSATGSILVKGKRVAGIPESLTAQPTKMHPSISKEDLYSEIEILTSSEVIERTIAYLNKSDKKTNNKNVPGTFKNRFSESKTILAVKKNLKIEVLPASKVINITYFSRKPQYAVDFLQAFLEQYDLYRMELFNPSGAAAFFSKQANKFKDSLENKEKALLERSDKNGVSDPHLEISNNLMIKKDLEKQLSLLKNDDIDKRSTIDLLSKAIKNNDIQMLSFIDNPTINNITSNMQDLLFERASILRTYNSSSKAVKNINNQIDNMYSLLSSEAKTYKNDLQDQLATIEDKLQNIKTKIMGIDKKNVELQKVFLESKTIMREADLLGASYETFSKRTEEAKISSAVHSTNLSTYVSILSESFPSDGPVFPRKKILIPLSLIIGFITGCSLSFLREYFDHTFKRPSDVLRYTDLSVIFSIPSWDNEKTDN